MYNLLETCSFAFYGALNCTLSRTCLGGTFMCYLKAFMAIFDEIPNYRHYEPSG